MIYDVGLAEILFSECSDPYCDRILCNAAAMILQATGGIADKRLGTYACGRLSGDIHPPPVKRARGRRADDHRWRNVSILGYLIPPLLGPNFLRLATRRPIVIRVFDRLAGVGNDRN